MPVQLVEMLIIPWSAFGEAVEIAKVIMSTVPDVVKASVDVNVPDATMSASVHTVKVSEKLHPMDSVTVTPSSVAAKTAIVLEAISTIVAVRENHKRETKSEDKSTNQSIHASRPVGKDIRCAIRSRTDDHT
ncbi:hypothetical protein ACEPAF_2984 [Sanghuangporus sanghuang]